MRITKGNYEAYLLDYAEGRLDEATVRELEGFLDRNPDIRAEWETFEPVYLEDEPVPDYPNKADLFNGSITIDNYEAYLLDYFEGNLDETGTADLMAFAQACPEAEKAMKAFKPVYLRPATLVPYPHKASLKRGAVIVPLWRRPALRWATAAAAVLLLAVPALRILSPEPGHPVTTGRSMSSIPEIIITPPDDSSTQNIEAPTPFDRHVRPVPQVSPVPGNNLAAVQPEETAGEMPEGSMRHQLPERMDRIEVAEVKTSRPVYGYTGVPRFNATDIINNEALASKGNETVPKGTLNRLANEFALGFLPEEFVVQEEEGLDNERKGLPNTLILELPKGGKKLFDSIFKSE